MDEIGSRICEELRDTGRDVVSRRCSAAHWRAKCRLLGLASTAMQMSTLFAYLLDALVPFLPSYADLDRLLHEAG